MAVTIGKEPGPVRIKLAEALSGFGYTFYPEDVNSNYPVYSSIQFDCCSWSAWGTDSAGMAVHVHSYDTMKECLRYGFTLDRDDRDVYNHFEAHANEHET